MTSHLDAAIQEQQALIQAIKHNSNRLTLPVMKVLFKTFIIPFVVFFGLNMVRTYILGYVAQNFGDETLNTMTAVSTLIVVLVGTWFSWRWAEQRFGGASLVKQMGQVTLAVARVETEIERAQAEGADNPEIIERITGLTQTAWDIYTQALHTAGIDISTYTPDTA